MIETIAMLLAADAAGGDTTPPTGSPTSPSLSVYGSPQKWRVTWVNADATAYTRIYVSDVTDEFAQATFAGIRNPGLTSFDSDELFGTPLDDQFTFYLVHYKNGQESTPPTEIDTI